MLEILLHYRMDCLLSLHEQGSNTHTINAANLHMAQGVYKYKLYHLTSEVLLLVAGSCHQLWLFRPLRFVLFGV